MNEFHKRERLYENSFIQEEELTFKAHARRNRLIGFWAAKKIDLSETDADQYVKTLVTADLDRPGSDKVFEILCADFKRKGIIISEDEIRRTMDELMTKALAEVRARQ